MTKITLLNIDGCAILWMWKGAQARSTETYRPYVQSIKRNPAIETLNNYRGVLAYLQLRQTELDYPKINVINQSKHLVM